MATQVDGVITKISTGDDKEYAVASTAYGYCQTAAATAAKEVDMDGFVLKTGVTIFVKFQYANSVANPTLNVNDTGAKPIYRYGTTRASTNASTNGWSAGAVLAFTYDGAGWIEHYWANNQYTLSNLYHGSGNFVADSPVYRYQMLFHVTDDVLTPLNNDNNVTATTKTMLTSVEFDPFNEIYLYNSTTNVADGGNIGGGACHWHYSAMDLRYTFNIANDYLTAHKNVYLKCSKQSNGKFRIASASPLTQALPTTNDGYHYIHLGRATSGYQMTLYRKHPIYYHDGTSVRIYTNPANVTNVSFSDIEGSPSDNNSLNSALAGKATSTHVHGNITNAGAITADTAVANGDKIIVADSSASSKLVRTGISFDGSTTTKALTPKGTWETFNNYSLPTASADTLGGVKVGTNLSISNGVLSATGGGSDVLWFPNQTVSQVSNSELFRITDSAITTDTIVLVCNFANKTTRGRIGYTSYDGYITFTGTSISATTADVILAKKSN